MQPLLGLMREKPEEPCMSGPRSCCTGGCPSIGGSTKFLWQAMTPPFPLSPKCRLDPSRRERRPFQIFISGLCLQLCVHFKVDTYCEMSTGVGDLTAVTASNKKELFLFSVFFFFFLTSRNPLITIII